MTYAVFRTSSKFHRARPPTSEKPARYVWDLLSQRGEIKSLRLIDGYWMALRPNDELDSVGADHVRYMTRRQRPKYRDCRVTKGKHKFERLKHNVFDKCMHCGEPRFAVQLSVNAQHDQGERK
jgi:hypothetical protein